MRWETDSERAREGEVAGAALLWRPGDSDNKARRIIRVLFAGSLHTTVF